MSTLIPNENCWIGFSETMPASATLVPTLVELAAAVDMTDFIISLTASSTGNTVPVPSLKSLFEKTIPGTSTATFTAEMYRDSIKAEDIAWDTLPRDTTGCFFIARFQAGVPVAADTIEAWPIKVTSRTASAMSSNTAQTFTLTCSVPEVPNEAALIAA
jgi:hypothetical protein